MRGKAAYVRLVHTLSAQLSLVFSLASMSHPLTLSAPIGAQPSCVSCVYCLCDLACRIVKHKWILLERVLALGYNALILDIDTVLLRNPFLYFRSAPACDLTVYENGLPSLEGPNKWQKRDWSSRFEVNTGFILVRNSASTKVLVHDFINSDVAGRHPGLDDQALFNRFMAERKWNASESSSLLLSLKNQSTQCGQWKGVSVHILPPVLFASWRHFFESRVFDWTLQTPFLVHYNYLTGFASKMSKMREHGFWHV